jgi:hypothetical protein
MNKKAEFHKSHRLSTISIVLALSVFVGLGILSTGNHSFSLTTNDITGFAIKTHVDSYDACGWQYDDAAKKCSRYIDENMVFCENKARNQCLNCLEAAGAVEARTYEEFCS